MIIRKKANDYNTFDIDLVNDGKVLSIYQGGADPNISCRFEDYRRISNITFDIPRDEEELYSIFEKLYIDIINGNVLGEDTSIPSVQESMKLQKSMSWYPTINQNGVITVMCDAYPLKCPNTLRITKLESGITLEFDKSQDMYTIKAPYSVSINIRQSGSRIYEFCIPFNTMFKQLQGLEEKKDNAMSFTKKWGR